MIVDPPYNQSEPPLLSLERITKKFGAVNALDDVSFTLRRGEIHALLGENGAGKTTLMRIAFGLIQPDSGTIAIESRRVRLASPADAIAAGLGMVHQQFSLVPAMTVAENIALGGRGRLVMKRLLERIEYVMTQTGLDLDPSATVASLGPAERQKLEILRTFAHDARVLILDEPTAVLTGPDTAELFAQIRRYTGAGNSVVLITHKLSDALKHAGFVTVLRKGRVVLESAASEQDELTLGAAMIGESLVEGAAPRNKGRLKTSQPLARIDSVEIHRGEIVGIAALEGAAKPYLASLTQRRRTPGTRITVGFVPENRKDDALIEDFSLVQNYALSNAGSLSGVLDWNELERSTEKVVRLFDVRTTGVEASPKQLSGGNQQRFVIGRELTRKPDLLVLENPTQGLDLKAAASVHMHLRNAAEAGAAVVFYSSDLDELAMYSDRVIVASGTGITPVPLNRDAIGHALLAIQ